MFASILAALAQSLDQAGLPYMVIGGQAVLVHGEARFTRDIDITLAAGPESLGKLSSVLGGLGWKALPENPEEFVAQTMVLPCEDPSTGIRLDFIFGLTLYESEAIRRSIPVVFEGVEVRFATREDLVVHKVIAGRPRDLEDVAGILVKNPGIDLTQIRGVLSEFERDLNLPLLETFEKLWAQSREGG